MTPETVTHLENVLKECWNTEIMANYLAAKKDIERQFIGIPVQYVETGTLSEATFDPSRPTQHRIRMEEMKQRIALLERKGKPSYRQRQKNGRSARRG